MIILEDKQVEVLEAQTVAEAQDPLNQEPPPTYASLQPSPSPSFAKAVNYVSISRLHSSIKETLTIDPSVVVPPFLRPPLLPGETEDTRQNLRLESTHGDVYADVTLVENSENPLEITSPQRNKRVIMSMETTHGAVTAKIHGPPNRTSFFLRAQSSYGNIFLHIPPTFQGPITISHRHGSVRLSDRVDQNLTTFGEVDNTRRCFLGDFSEWDDSCCGDELVIDVRHGNVNIHYDDDHAVGYPVKSRPTLLNRIFGF